MLNKYFVEGLLETISTMTGFTLEELNIPKEEEKKVEIAGAMLLVGEKNGMLVISASKASARILVMYMTGVDYENQKDEDLFDVLAELVNMVAGIAKSKLLESEYTFKLSSPFSIAGDNIKIITKKSVDRYESIVGSSQVQLKIELYYL